MRSKLPDSPVQQLNAPDAFNINTKIVADEDVYIPKYSTDGSAAVDLVGNIPPDHAGNRVVTLPHRATAVIDCGFSMELPPGFKANVSARSGLASRGLIVTNGPGIIDSDYRGRVKVIVTNVGKEIIVLNHLDRIAQMTIEPVYLFQWESVDALSETERGEGGLGSTGVTANG